MKMRSEAGGTIVALLERGEPVRAAIESLARDENLRGARVHAIGALEDPEIGYYQLDRKVYETTVLKGRYELVSLEGNLSLKDGAPMLHAHVALAGPDFVVHGGHLVDAKVGVVVELFVEPLERPLERELDAGIGLPVWNP